MFCRIAACLVVTVMGSVFLTGERAQATIIDFQSLEHDFPTGQTAPPGTGYFYSENGFDFVNSSHLHAFQTWSTSSVNYLGSTALWNGDGTGTSGLTTLTRSDGGAFNLLSMDIAELNLSGGMAPVKFDGILEGGGTVSLDFTTDGVRTDSSGFETVNFSGFTNLTSVSWIQVVPYIQFDNVNVEAVPEPSGLALLGIAGIGLAAYRRRKRKLAA